MFFKCRANGLQIEILDGGGWRFQCQINEVESSVGYPCDLLEEVFARVIHGADEHKIW
jgi:hypothetical protein